MSEDIEELFEELDSNVNNLRDDTEHLFLELEEDISSVRNEVVQLRVQLAEIQKILSIALEPSEESQERFKTLREAYKKYEFVKDMTIGDKR